MMPVWTIQPLPENKENRCPICLEDISSGVSAAWHTERGDVHPFHKECFDRYRASINDNKNEIKCPCCRKICLYEPPHSIRANPLTKRTIIGLVLSSLALLVFLFPSPLSLKICAFFFLIVFSLAALLNFARNKR